MPHLLAHSDNIAAAIKSGAKTLPHMLDGRVRDNWDALFCVADLAGGDWPARALAAMQVLLAAVGSASSYAKELIEDIKWVCQTPARHTSEAWREYQTAVKSGKPGTRPARIKPWPDQIHSAALLAALHAMPERPWTTFGKAQKPITEHWLARQLDEYGVKSKQARIPLWPFDAAGEPSTLKGVPPAVRKLPNLRVYSIAELRAIWRRYT